MGGGREPFTFNLGTRCTCQFPQLKDYPVFPEKEDGWPQSYSGSQGEQNNLKILYWLSYPEFLIHNVVKSPCYDVHSMFLIIQTTATLTLGGEDRNRAGPLNLQLASKMLSKKVCYVGRKKCVTLGAKIFEIKKSFNSFLAKPSLNTEAILSNH